MIIETLIGFAGGTALVSGASFLFYRIAKKMSEGRGIAKPLPLPITLLPSADVSEDVAAAAAWWNRRVGAEVFKAVGDIGRGGVVPVVSNRSRLRPGRTVLRIAGGRITFAEVRLSVHPAHSAARARIFAHELGHVLGLGHDADPGSVMYSVVIDRPFGLSGADQRRVLSYL